MTQVTVHAFGGPEQFTLESHPLPEPGAGQIRLRITSIGMNHADLMARRGEYRLVSGDPPFTPGLEAGGLVDALGPNVTSLRRDQRVTLTPDAPRSLGGTYRSHYLTSASQVMPVPDAVPDDQLGALWLPYLTAWGCFVWKHGLRPGATVALPAASSSVALAAAQIVKHLGGTAIGLTRSEAKASRLRQLNTAAYDHLLVTHEPDSTLRPWHRQIKTLTDGRGVDLFFDPVAAGPYLESEIKCLATHGCVWIYGLLARPDAVDLTPLIRKHAAVRGWALAELIAAGQSAWRPGCEHILEGFAAGWYRQHVDTVYPLHDVQHAHRDMETGDHVGKLVLRP